MSSISLNGDTSGAVLLQAPAIAGSTTLTLPTGTATLGIDGPAFYAYNNTTQSISTGTFVKVALPLEGFDTANAFDATTNYRFTPLTAGYYQISGAVYGNGTNRLIVSLFKNGTELFRGSDFSATAGYSGMVSALVYCNGSTDYVELYTSSGNVGTIGFAGATALNWMTGSLVRGA